MTLEMTDPEMIKIFTGLSSAENIEYIAVSDPMMNSEDYSLVLAKVKDGVDVDAVAKEINENVDTTRWKSEEPKKVYTVSSGNVICLVISNEDTAKALYEDFKTKAGSVGQEYERTEVVEY